MTRSFASMISVCRSSPSYLLFGDSVVRRVVGIPNPQEQCARRELTKLTKEYSPFLEVPPLKQTVLMRAEPRGRRREVERICRAPDGREGQSQAVSRGSGKRDERCHGLPRVSEPSSIGRWISEYLNQRACTGTRYFVASSWSRARISAGQTSGSIVSVAGGCVGSPFLHSATHLRTHRSTLPRMPLRYWTS
jgi:hypothetical protein